MYIALQNRQEVNLKMTFELSHAIALLQMSTYELLQYMKEQELENPLIELQEKKNISQFEERSHLKPLNNSATEFPVEAVNQANEITRDELYGISRLTYADSYTCRLLKFLIFNLDDSGYLRFSYDNSGYYVLYTEQEVTNGIQLLQKIGPPGIGARSLKECLLLQIKSMYPDHCLAAALLENHIELVADRKWKEISSIYKISLEEVKNIYDFIQSLNPRPCSFLSNSLTEYITPDIIVEIKNGDPVFSLNDDYLPIIAFNKDYQPHKFPKGDLSKYVHNQYQKYNWLINSIEQRRNTIIKIVNVLLVKQRQFFLTGFSSLQPLTLKEVADEIEMHESTVSRVTANKVLQTPFGSFQLKMLFSSKLETSNGSSISQTTVKNLLVELIKNENKHKPYSDNKIAEIFNKEKGITISRRTVSKYREELKLPPSNRRKEIKV